MKQVCLNTSPAPDGFLDGGVVSVVARLMLGRVPVEKEALTGKDVRALTGADRCT